MKNFNFSSMGVHEMNSLEMQETAGGFGLIILAVCALALTLPFCTTYEDMGVYFSIFPPSTPPEGAIDLAERYDMPIGY